MGETTEDGFWEYFSKQDAYVSAQSFPATTIHAQIGQQFSDKEQLWLHFLPEGIVLGRWRGYLWDRGVDGEWDGHHVAVRIGTRHGFAGYLDLSRVDSQIHGRIGRRWRGLPIHYAFEKAHLKGWIGEGSSKETIDIMTRDENPLITAATVSLSWYLVVCVFHHPDLTW